jgi:hypothetical protein
VWFSGRWQRPFTRPDITKPFFSIKTVGMQLGYDDLPH